MQPRISTCKLIEKVYRNIKCVGQRTASNERIAQYCWNELTCNWEDVHKNRRTHQLAPQSSSLHFWISQELLDLRSIYRQALNQGFKVNLSLSFLLYVIFVAFWHTSPPPHHIFSHYDYIHLYHFEMRTSDHFQNLKKNQWFS